jgi:hypothetical protein
MSHDANDNVGLVAIGVPKYLVPQRGFYSLYVSL